MIVGAPHGQTSILRNLEGPRGTEGLTADSYVKIPLGIWAPFVSLEGCMLLIMLYFLLFP